MAKGLIGNLEMIDSLLEDCNNSVKSIVDGQYISWCAQIAVMAQKLKLLKDGIRKDMMNREDTIEKLKEALRQSGREVEEYSAEDLTNGKEINTIQVTDEEAKKCEH